MTDRPVYLVNAERDGEGWLVRVRDHPGVFGQADSEDDILDAARDVIALKLDVPPDSFDVRRIRFSKWSEIKRRKGAR